MSGSNRITRHRVWALSLALAVGASALGGCAIQTENGDPGSSADEPAGSAAPQVQASAGPKSGAVEETGTTQGSSTLSKRIKRDVARHTEDNTQPLPWQVH
jgi:hypothetical protein